MTQKYLEILNELKNYPMTKLHVVSKNRSTQELLPLYELGQRDFAENRVDELILKSEQLAHLKIHWHMIGHLQKNKISKLASVKYLTSIQSIDSAQLIEQLLKAESKFCEHNLFLKNNSENRIKLYLQVNTSFEEEKSGFAFDDRLTHIILNLAERLSSSSVFSLAGLMTIATIRTHNKDSEARRCFMALAQLKSELIQHQKLSSLELSMGMSQDYRTALECQSNILRIGSLLF